MPSQKESKNSQRKIIPQMRGKILTKHENQTDLESKEKKEEAPPHRNRWPADSNTGDRFHQGQSLSTKEVFR